MVTVAATARPAEKSSIPVVTTRLVPKRATSFEESGANTIIAAGVGQDAHAGGRRRVAEDELQVLRRQEEEPEEGEEQHHDRAAGRGEARVLEEADVEQRLLDAALPDHERDQRDRGERTGGEHRGGRPALRRALR